MLVNRRKIQIEWGDCDPGGIVYFPRYYEYCDASTLALFARAGLPKPQMLEKYGIAGMPMVEQHASFFAPAEHPDIIVIETKITEWGRTSFQVQHKIFKSKTLLAEITEKRVWVKRVPGNRHRFKSHPIPTAVKSRFAARRNSKNL